MGPNARTLGLALTSDENTSFSRRAPDAEYVGAYYANHHPYDRRTERRVKRSFEELDRFLPGDLVLPIGDPVVAAHELTHRVQDMGGAPMSADDQYIQELTGLMADIGANPDIDMRDLVENSVNLRERIGDTPYGQAELIASLASMGLSEIPREYRELFGLPSTQVSAWDLDDNYAARAGRSIMEEAQRIYDAYLNRNVSGAMKERAERTLEEPVNRLTERGAAGRPTYF